MKKAIDSGWLTKGPKTKELEDGISGYLGVKYAVTTSSGTAALHLSLLALGIGPGDEVIVPDFTFPATANTVELCGARAVLADIELSHFNIDPVEVEKKITHRTSAIIPVHQFGNPAEMREILKVARRHNLYVIEDAACALGARYNRKMCGAIGDLGCFSFHPRKIITTGEGGAVVTNNSRLAGRLKLLREHGMRQNAAKRSFASIGFNYRISEIASILGLSQLRKIEDIVKNRIRLAREFRRIIAPLNGISATPAHINKHNRYTYQSFVVRINKKINIFRLISFLKAKGIESTPSNIALHTQPYYQKKYGFKKGEFKNSLFAFRRSLALPFHCRMKQKDFFEIFIALKEYIG